MASAKVISLKPRDRSSIVDEFGQLDSELASFKPKINRHAQLRAQIQSWYDKEAPEQEFAVEGEQFVVDVGPRSLERKIISMRELKTRLGLVRFLKLCKFPLSVLDEIIAPAEQTSLVSQERTGTRRVAVTRKYSGAEAA